MKRRERPAAKSIAARPINCVGLNVPHPFRVWLSLGQNHEKHQFFACWKAAAAEDDNMALDLADRSVSNQLGTFRTPCCSPTKRR